MVASLWASHLPLNGLSKPPNEASRRPLLMVLVSLSEGSSIVVSWQSKAWFALGDAMQGWGIYRAQSMGAGFIGGNMPALKVDTWR